MALRNAFENLGLDSTLQAIRDRLPAALGGNGGVKVEQQGALPTGTNTIGGVKVVDSAGTNQAAVSAAGAVKVDGSAVTQPVSGSVVADQGGTWNITNVTGTVSLPTGAATSAKQSDGSQKTQVVDGSGNVISATSNALDVNIKSGGAAAGTQYAEGATAATATGTLAMGKNGTTLKAAQTDASGNLRVDLSQTSANATAIKVDGSSATQPVSGTVTANAGTNLNTSALALESGGNLASIKTDVDNLNLSQGSTTSGQKGNLILGATTTAAPTYTTAQSNPLSLTTGGLLRVDGSSAIQPVSGTVTSTQAATTSNVGAYEMTDAIFSGTTSLTPKGASITASASGVTTLVAAVAGKHIRVLQIVLIANGAVNAKFQSHVTPTDLTGLFYLAANSGFSSGYSPLGQFQTSTGEALDINLSGAVAVGGYLTYVEA